MEYSYTHIEAHIRHAQVLRSQALADILAAAYKKCGQWFHGLIASNVQQSNRSSTSPSF